MLHRDVSVNNIMYEIREGKFYFILIDFDMAVRIAPDESSYVASSRYRTGTLPFMAYELVKDAHYSSSRIWSPIRHLLRCWLIHHRCILGC